MYKQVATYHNAIDLQEYTETVTAYFTQCTDDDDVPDTKTITGRANLKPWLTGKSTRVQRWGQGEPDDS